MADEKKDKVNAIEKLMDKYYEYKDFPCRWEKKMRPVVYKTKSQKQIIDDMFDFFNEASQISEKEFNEMMESLPEGKGDNKESV